MPALTLVDGSKDEAEEEEDEEHNEEDISAIVQSEV